MKHGFYHRCFPMLLVLSMLLTFMVPIASARPAGEREMQTRAVTVPAISSPYTTHPVVYIVDDTYQIAFATNSMGIAWVEIGGVKYNDSTNGLMNWNSKYHKVTVPQSKDGQEYYSKTDVYSVAEYAYGKLDSIKATDTAELKAICANLLRYGSMAQAQFGYRTDALVDAAMTDAHKAYLTDLSTVEMKDFRKQLSDLDTVIVPWKSTTLELGNKVIMCLIANLANYAGDPSELTMHLTFTDNYGATITETRPLRIMES